MNILAIDPGNRQSAFVVLDGDTLRPLEFDKLDNYNLLDKLADMEPMHMAIEMVASYGMPVGAEVFETCVWIGRFWQATSWMVSKSYVFRREEKLAICHSPRANDATIRQALIDRFASGVPNKGKGTRREPGWFYGFHADIWQAYAVGVTWADKNRTRSDQTGQTRTNSDKLR